MFIRKIEDFECEHCGSEVTGTGYTDHCPHCLWSKHVDIEPGDRAASCGGMMRPVRISGIVDRYVIDYLCESCGHTKRNKVQNEDEHDAIIRVAQMSADDRTGYRRTNTVTEEEALCDNPDHELLKEITTPDDNLMAKIEREVEEGDYHDTSFDTDADGNKIVEDYN